MARVSTAFVVAGIEPAADPLWRRAGEAVRREFWRVVVGLVKDSNEFERARGRDRFGRKLKSITRYTRAHRRSAMGPADANAAPLVPADGASRTVAYFAGRAFADHAQFFWRNDWGKVLHYHRVGAKNRRAKSGRLPVRDVIGIGRVALGRVAARAGAWWDVRRRALAPPQPEPAPERPVPKPKAKPKTVPKPLPVPKAPKVAARRAAKLPQIEVVPRGVRPPARSKKILVFEVKRLTGPPTPGEAARGLRRGQARP